MIHTPCNLDDIAPEIETTHVQLFMESLVGHLFGPQVIQSLLFNFSNCRNVDVEGFSDIIDWVAELQTRETSDELDRFESLSRNANYFGQQTFNSVIRFKKLLIFNEVKSEQEENQVVAKVDIANCYTQENFFKLLDFFWVRTYPKIPIL